MPEDVRASEVTYAYPDHGYAVPAVSPMVEASDKLRIAVPYASDKSSRLILDAPLSMLDTLAAAARVTQLTAVARGGPPLLPGTIVCPCGVQMTTLAAVL